MSLIPWAPSQWTDDLGRPLAFGKLYLYQAGTLIPKATYQDAAHTVAHPFPITLDATGRSNVWLIDDEAYDLVVHDSNDNVLRSVLSIVTNGNAGGGTPSGTTSVCAKSSFPENAITWDTDPDAARFRTDGCFCWIYPAQNVSRIKWFKTVSAFNATYPTGKVSIWGALSEDFADGVKLDEFILPDSTPVGVQTMDHDVSAYRWIGVACDPGLIDPGVPVAQTGFVLPSYTPSLAPRYFGYIGQHAHNTTFATFPPIYADEVRYMWTRWMELGLIYTTGA